jgi:FixJ family two-component response regulator
MDMNGRDDISANQAAANEGNPNNDLVDTPVLDQKIQDAIGRSLKAHYNDLVSAPVPDRLLALLAELEAKEEGRGS